MAADLRSENCETMSKTGGVQIGLDTACQKSGGVRTPWTLKDLRLWFSMHFTRPIHISSDYCFLQNVDAARLFMSQSHSLAFTAAALYLLHEMGRFHHTN